MDHGPVLAPFYDLLSTAVYPELSDKLAMKVGGEDRPDWITGRRWEQFAKDIGVSSKIVNQSLLRMGKKIISEAKALEKEFTMQYGECELIDKIVDVIEMRVRKVSMSFTAAE